MKKCLPRLRWTLCERSDDPVLSISLELSAVPLPVARFATIEAFGAVALALAFARLALVFALATFLAVFSFATARRPSTTLLPCSRALAFAFLFALATFLATLVLDGVDLHRGRALVSRPLHMRIGSRQTELLLNLLMAPCC